MSRASRGARTPARAGVHQLTRLRQRYAATHKLAGTDPDYPQWADSFTKVAKRALGLMHYNDKYPQDLTAQGSTPEGIAVRLTSGHYSKEHRPSVWGRGKSAVTNSSQHRLQYHCPHCHTWQPTGRFHQHMPVHYPVG